MLAKVRDRVAWSTALAALAIGCGSAGATDRAPGAPDPLDEADAGADVVDAATLDARDAEPGDAGDASIEVADAAPLADADASLDAPLADADVEVEAALDGTADAPLDVAPEGPDDAAHSDASLLDAAPDALSCHAVEQAFTPQAGVHVADCSPLTWPTNPPSSGPHYPVWASFRAYDAPVPRGYWVHDLEHGAIVVTYNCAGGCAAEIAAAKAWMAALPDDPLCVGTGPKRRVVLTPDPLLDVRWAASAWGFTLRADCFDDEAFTAFYLAHFGGAPEMLCADGLDFTGPDGGVAVAPGCGEPDGGADASAD